MKKLVLLVSFSALLIGCSKGSPSASADTTIAINETQNTAATAEFNKENTAILDAYKKSASPFDKLPEIPLEFDCDNAGKDKEICISDEVQIIKAWRDAWKGDYQGQRNVAYSLSTYDIENLAKIEQKPDGGYILGESKIQGCAWRIVIQKSGHVDYNSSDDANLKHDCGILDTEQKVAATEQAKTILAKIKM